MAIPGLILLWITLASRIVLAGQIKYVSAGGGSSTAASQGNCPAFVKECYKTCFSLAQVQVAYTCSLNNGQYMARCICGSNDQTQVVLAKAQIPAAITTTLQNVQTQNVLITATSIASSTLTTTATTKASVCSSTTIISTVLTTSTLTAAPTTVTSIITTTVSTTQTAIPTAVPGAVVSTDGTGSGKKRGLSSFCPDIQLACKVGCAAFWSTPSANICQALPWGSKYSVACVCKNNVNVVQQIIQAYNLVRAVGNKCTSVSATTVAATTTTTVVAISTSLVTHTTVVVPTTILTVITNTVTQTNTYACPTTQTTVQPITATQVPTTTTIATTTLTSVTVVTPVVYNVAFSQAGAVPSYIAQAIKFDNDAQPADDKNAAQAFVVLPSTTDSGLYDILGIGPGDFDGQYLGGQYFLYEDAYSYYELDFAATSTPGGDSPGSIWKFNPATLALGVSWISMAGPPRTDLQTCYDSGNTLPGATDNLQNANQFAAGYFKAITMACVPA